MYHLDLKDILCFPTDNAMSLSILKEDHLYKKIPKDKIEYYIKSSIDVGNKASMELLQEYEDKPLKEICDNMKLEVFIDKEESDFEILKLRGKYEESKNRLTLSHRSLKIMEEKFKTLGLDFLDYNYLYEILLAKGLFKHLEATKIGLTYEKVDKASTFKLGFIKKTFPVKKTSEIAGEIFAKNILKLSFNPKVLDYMFLIGNSHVNESYLIDFFQGLEKELKTSN